MVSANHSVILLFVINTLMIIVKRSASVPIQILQEHRPEYTPSKDDHELENKNSHVFGQAVGTAIAPIVGAVVGPLLINIANGITNGITTSVSLGYEPLHYPSSFEPEYEAFVVDVEGYPQPYILLKAVHKENNSQDSAEKEKPDENLSYYGGATHYNNKNKKRPEYLQSLPADKKQTVNPNVKYHEIILN